MSVNLLSTGALYGVSILGGGGTLGVAATLGVSTGDYQSVKIGQQAAQLQQGGCNVFMGQNVAELSSNGNNNAVVGYLAARTLVGDGNTVFGSVAASTLGPIGASNVTVGCGADVTAQNASGAVSVGARASASSSSTSVGSAATASGFRSVAIGTNTRASGTGSFTLANRLRGYSSGGSYAVHVDADVLKLANGGMLGFCDRTLTAVSSAASAEPLDQVPSWRMGLEGDDLVLRSVRGAVVRFVDDYRSSVLNFTASHHVLWASPASYVHGLCAIPSQVRLANLHASRHPLAYTLVQVIEPESDIRMTDGCCDDAEADASLPRVAVWLSERSGWEADAASVFGVIAARQGGASGARQIGNVTFGAPDANANAQDGVTVHAAGDGRVWVYVDAEERRTYPVGTLLTAHLSIPGVACPQEGCHTQQYTSSTVAKTTQTIRCASQPSGHQYHLVNCTYRM